MQWEPLLHTQKSVAVLESPVINSDHEPCKEPDYNSNCIDSGSFGIKPGNILCYPGIFSYIVEYHSVLWTNFQKLVPLKSFYLFLFLEQKGKFQVYFP